MKPRSTSRCVRVGDVLVLEALPKEVLDPDSDESIESHREKRARKPIAIAEADERGVDSSEPDYEGPVLLHEP
jgi:hypothetical protein